MRLSLLSFGLLSALDVASANVVLESGLDVVPLSPLLQRAAVYGVERRNETSNDLTGADLKKRQSDGRCGADFGGQRCGGSQCCSAYGYCGSDPEHCAELVGCQPQYGRCGDAPAEPTTSSTTSTPTPTPTTSSTTSRTSSSTSTSSSSSSSLSSSSMPPIPTGTLTPSMNGLCGNSTTCAGSGFGDCCSEWYWCGSSPDHCGTGCRLGFGNCGGGESSSSSSSSSTAPSTSTSPSATSSSTSTTSSLPTTTPTPTQTTSSTSTSTSTSSSTTSTAPTPTSTVPVSIDGRCGENQRSCTGSSFGRCCSDYGWCGNDDIYCRPSWGCQPQWGICGSGFE